MLKKIIVIGLLLVSASFAAEKSSSSKIGLGVDDSAFVYATFDLSPKFRFEPAIQLRTLETSPTSETEYMHYKLRLFAMGEVKNKKHFYYGATFEDYETKPKVGNKTTYSYFTATAGLEYFVDTQVSISGEFGVALFGDASGLQSSLLLKYYF